MLSPPRCHVLEPSAPHGSSPLHYSPSTQPASRFLPRVRAISFPWFLPLPGLQVDAALAAPLAMASCFACPSCCSTVPGARGSAGSCVAQHEAEDAETWRVKPERKNVMLASKGVPGFPRGGGIHLGALCTGLVLARLLLSKTPTQPGPSWLCIAQQS